jgi:hypothetical protein
MAYKQIQVTEQTHAKIAQIARANYRGIGDQVTLWADTTCAHPLAQRVEVRVVVASIITLTEKVKKGQVGIGQSFYGFFCRKCNQYLINQTPNAEIQEAISGLLVENTSKAEG